MNKTADGTILGIFNGDPLPLTVRTTVQPNTPTKSYKNFEESTITAQGSFPSLSQSGKRQVVNYDTLKDLVSIFCHFDI